MHRFIGTFILIVVIVALIGGNATGILRIFVLLLFLGAAVHVMFKQHLPKRFGEILILLIFGPSLLICLISMILNSFPGQRFNINWLTVIVIMLLILYSWYGWRRWQNRKRKQADQYQLRGSEREFILPFSHRTDRNRNSTMDDET